MTQHGSLAPPDSATAAVAVASAATAAHVTLAAPVAAISPSASALTTPGVQWFKPWLKQERWMCMSVTNHWQNVMQRCSEIEIDASIGMKYATAASPAVDLKSPQCCPRVAVAKPPPRGGKKQAPRTAVYFATSRYDTSDTSGSPSSSSQETTDASHSPPTCHTPAAPTVAPTCPALRAAPPDHSYHPQEAKRPCTDASRDSPPRAAGHDGLTLFGELLQVQWLANVEYDLTAMQCACMVQSLVQLVFSWTSVEDDDDDFMLPAQQAEAGDVPYLAHSVQDEHKEPRRKTTIPPRETAGDAMRTKRCQFAGIRWKHQYHQLRFEDYEQFILAVYALFDQLGCQPSDDTKEGWDWLFTRFVQLMHT